MSRPDLYRFCDNALPQFDAVRPGIDVNVVDGRVQPNTGGISVFALKFASWPSSKTFVLSSALTLPPGLVAHHDRGIHWLLQASREMTLEEYKTELSLLNSLAVVADDGVAGTSLNLPERSSNDARAVRFLFTAFTRFSRQRIKVDGWDENDYSYLLVLASELHNNAMPVRALTWSPGVPWTRELAFANHAIHAYMLWTNAKAQGDEDLEADAVNDNGYLRAILGMHKEGNPYAHLIVYSTDIGCL